MTPIEEFNDLACRELDLWLEQRACYRALVRAGKHRGVPVPTKPRDWTLRTKRSRRSMPRVLHRDCGVILDVV